MKKPWIGKEYLTVGEAAAILGMSPKRLGKRLDQGMVPFVQYFGRGWRRIPASWVEGALGNGQDRK